MMGSLAVIVTIAILIGLFEVPLLKKKGYHRDLTFFYLFMVLTVLIGGLANRYPKQMNPLEWITWIYGPITSFVMKWLEQ